MRENFSPTRVANIIKTDNTHSQWDTGKQTCSYIIIIGIDTILFPFLEFYSPKSMQKNTYKNIYCNTECDRENRKRFKCSSTGRCFPLYNHVTATTYSL